MKSRLDVALPQRGRGGRVGGGDGGGRRVAAAAAIGRRRRRRVAAGRVRDVRARRRRRHAPPPAAAAVAAAPAAGNTHTSVHNHVHGTGLGKEGREGGGRTEFRCFEIFVTTYEIADWTCSGHSTEQN